MTRPPRSILFHYLRTHGRDFETATREAEEIVALLKERGHGDLVGEEVSHGGSQEVLQGQ